MKKLCKSDRLTNQRHDIFNRDNNLCRVCKWRTAGDVYHSSGYKALKGYEPHVELLAVCHWCCHDLHGIGFLSGSAQAKAQFIASKELAINLDRETEWCDIRKVCVRCDSFCSYANLLCEDCLRKRSGWNFRVDHRSRQQKLEFNTPPGNENEVKILEESRGEHHN